MPKLIIDGQEIEALDGMTILMAARANGIEIPTYCYYPWFPPSGNCRMCLVEVEGIPKLQIACGTYIREGMVVNTNNDRVHAARRGVMEFLLLHHPLDCPICDQAGECDLQDYGYKYGWPVGRTRHTRRTFTKTDYGEKVAKEANRCIHCRRCIKLSQNALHAPVIGAFHRGDRMEIGSFIETMVPSGWAGNLIDVCPVGALTDKKMRFSVRSWDLQFVAAHREDCEHGCQVLLGLYRGKIYRVSARVDKNRIMKSLICDECRFEHFNLDEWVIDEDYTVDTPVKNPIFEAPDPEKKDA